MKALLGILIASVSVDALAADDILVRRSLDQVRASRLELQEVQRQLPSNLRDIVLQTLQRLDYADQALSDSLHTPGRPIPPPPRPPSYGGYAELEATCELDDDIDFSPGQITTGVLRGTSVHELIQKCRSLAAMRGSQFSLGLRGLRALSKPAHFVQATCEIDDDVDFSPGQPSVGVLVGENFTDVAEQCLAVAQASYRNSGSAGIKNPVLGQRVDGHRRATATCQLDDDPDFSEGQIVFGKIEGRNVIDVAEQCAAIARLTYGAKGSSGLRDVREE